MIDVGRVRAAGSACARGQPANAGARKHSGIARTRRSERARSSAAAEGGTSRRRLNRRRPPLTVPAVTDPATAVVEFCDPDPSPAVVEAAVSVGPLEKLLEAPSPHAKLNVRSAIPPAVVRASGQRPKVVTRAKSMARHKNDAKDLELPILSFHALYLERDLQTVRVGRWSEVFQYAPARMGNQLRSK